jgi:hypothetical protein
MSIVEGGPFKCPDHDIITEDVKEWDAHCLKAGHTINSKQGCYKCGKTTKVVNFPYPPRYQELTNIPQEYIAARGNIAKIACANPECELFDSKRVSEQGGILYE